MSLKKAELHVHLEGTISPSLALKLAKRNQIELVPSIFSEDKESYRYDDFLAFLKAYDDVAAVIKKPEDYYDITFDYLSQNAKKGAIYIEMMYSPDHAEQSSNIPSKEHLKAIKEAIDDAEKQFNVVGRIIMTAVRHYGEEAAIKVAKQALKEDMPYIVGFGLGGDEINFPPKMFAKAYEIAAAGGLACTVHAGEFADANGMLEAMKYLPIKRIGHGVKGIHSLDTLKQLRDKGIALELCPSSNVALGLYDNIMLHPLPKFKEEGIRFSINSDDPPFFRTHLAREYELVQKHFDYSEGEMNQITSMAIDDAFADEKTKAKLKKQIEA